MDRVIHWASHFLSSLLEFLPTIDNVKNWASHFLSSLLEFLPTIDNVKNWFVSLISCLAIKINPIVEKITGHKFNVETDTCAEEITMDGAKLLHVVGVIGVVVVAIVVLYLLCKVIFGCFCGLCEVIFGCCRGLCSGLRMVIFGCYRGLRKVIFGCYRGLRKAIFECCRGRRGRTMKAPGWNHRIFRNDFERNPANYFRNLRNNRLDLDIV